MTIQEYLIQVGKRYRSGISKEHAYRFDLENLLRSLAPDADVTNEPANVTDCGNPDFVITKGKIPVGYIEAKDIGKDLSSKQYKEQFTRYRNALDNLIITDYLRFQFFQNDKLLHEVCIAEIKDGEIVSLPEKFAFFTNFISEFCAFAGQTVKSAQKLAELMAGKARLLQNILENAVSSDEQNEENTSLRGQLGAFRKVLIHDLKPEEFSDIYAQTLAYGMFAARLHDPSLKDFSRQKAAELIPKSNPFLRKLFQYIAGYDIDGRIRSVVDNLADVFRAADLVAIMANFGQTVQQHDPVIHFYETFLAAYDPKLRKSRGIWYTPEPVVSFIVRAVDDILKSEFGLSHGLADNSKIKIKINSHEHDNRSKTGYKQIEKSVHRVQILDPACGTGTFLAQVVKQIYNYRFKAMQGIWTSYVENDLIPRLNGFELLMASYAMAHLKLDLLLGETGFQPKKTQRFHIYLTNSLEEHHPDTGTLFAQWLSDEANEANHIKRDSPVMVVLGNPPYAVSSSNKSEWIQKLTSDYKKDLNERNIQPLSDDYIKFIRFGQYLIDKNGEGVLAYISNNSFIDGIIHRQMRKNLLECFNKIYILDLHGNAKKKESAPDGSKDENVFDIMQGVSISLFIKMKSKKEAKELFHFDLYGKRQEKYDFLNENRMTSIAWNRLELKEPNFFFVKKHLENISTDNFSIEALFIKNNVGINTEFDELIIQYSKSDAEKLSIDLKCKTDSEILDSYKLKSGYRNKVSLAKKDILKNRMFVKTISYRPFDERYTIYTGRSNGIMGRPRNEIMHNMFKENIALIAMRQYSYNVPYYCYSFLSKNIAASRLFISNKGYCYVFPLYLYPETDSQQTIDSANGNPERMPNLNMEIVEKIGDKLGLRFVPEKDSTASTFAPIDLLDYIYAVLHSPAYREKYKEFLKIDFPRVPYPENADTFQRFVAYGGELRQIHLLASPKVEQFITAYPEDGDNTITRKISKKDWELYDADKQIGRIRINDSQYFDKIPLTAWEFYIGGYQPAQKWLKDRHGRTLSYDDILHYQKIIVALTETDRIMKAIDALSVCVHTG